MRVAGGAVLTVALAALAGCSGPEQSPPVAPPPQGLAPVGSVVAYAGPIPPDDWLVCDGRAVAQADYPELFAAIDTVHGTGDGRSTFQLPDYRGRFLRGVDAGAGRDPDATGREPAAAGGSAGDAVGSVQDDAFARHAHEHRAFKLKDIDWQRSVKHPRNGTGELSARLTTDEAGGAETRPDNAYVVWLIRAR